MDKPMSTEIKRMPAPEPAAGAPDYAPNSLRDNIIDARELFSRLPLQEIPLTDEFHVDEEDEHVADHEFWHHGYIAYKLDIAVDEISVVPLPGVYRGVTRLKSLPEDFRKMQVVAAGGVVHGVGAGNDTMKVQEGERMGGISLTEAIEEARNFIKDIDPEVRRVANRIVAKMKTVSGWKIPEILERAQMEIELFGEKDPTRVDERKAGISKKYADFVQRVRSINDRILDDPHAITIHEETEYEFTNDGRIKKYRVVNGQREEMPFEDACGACGMTEGHASSCINKSKTNTPVSGDLHPEEELDIAA